MNRTDRYKFLIHATANKQGPITITGELDAVGFNKLRHDLLESGWRLNVIACPDLFEEAAIAGMDAIPAQSIKFPQTTIWGNDEIGT